MPQRTHLGGSALFPRKGTRRASITHTSLHGISPVLYTLDLADDSCRTDLRVVKMTELYNLDAYSMRQFRLRRENILNGCIAFNKETVRDVRGCHRTFNERANAETKIELEVPDEKTGIVTNRTVAGALDSIELDEGNRDSEGVGYKLFPVDELSRPVRHEYASEAKVVATYTSGLILAARIFGDLHDVYPVA